MQTPEDLRGKFNMKIAEKAKFLAAVAPAEQSSGNGGCNIVYLFCSPEWSLSLPGSSSSTSALVAAGSFVRCAWMSFDESVPVLLKP